MRCVLSVLILLVPAVLRADLAPVKFVGGNLVPVRESKVSLRDAEVNITWGTPCKLDARFTLNNASRTGRTMELGFPVGEYNPDDVRIGRPLGAYRSRAEAEAVQPAPGPPPGMERVDASEILFEINGRPAEAYRKVRGKTSFSILTGDSGTSYWYYCRARLRKGTNVIRVVTHLEPSRFAAYRMVLAYCIWTGGRWRGPIGHERVAIHFPAGLRRETVYRLAPASGAISGNSIVWNFVKINPVRDEYDIEAEFLAPSVAAKLAEMRHAWQKAPESRDATLRYARHLFLLGQAKGNAGFPPLSLSRAEYDAVIQRTTVGGAKGVMQRCYRLGDDGRFHTAKDESDKDWGAVVRILADAGFCESYEGVDSVRKARRLLQRWLAGHPKDAGAWNLYLDNYWRFSFAAQGDWFGMVSPFGHLQKAAIEKAFRFCPGDPAIRYWHSCVQNGTNADLRTLRQLEKGDGNN